ncbi:hypothetical protein J3R82DRAFT_11053 [Butyriboletus roseoflavus]|nr:hypothetical protein J3R82DRAFT_11053 [Butyriboletus roseoflavus]
MIIATIFGFETSTVKAVQQQNCNLVVELKKNLSFIYRTCGLTLDQHDSIYQNKGIQQLINEVLFKSKSNNGIKWAKYYKPFPTSAFALTLTALQCTIDEWATRSRKPIPFKKYEYTSVFTAHFQSLNDFADASAKYDLVPKLMEQVYNNGCVHANVETDAAPPKMTAVPQQAFMNAICDYKCTEKV